MKVYTKTGDAGTTSLVGGTRIAKNDIRLDAYGTVDELNSWLGFILSLDEGDETTRTTVLTVQNRLFDIGCCLASETDCKYSVPTVSQTDTQSLENAIDRMEEVLPCHDRFILPGGTQASSAANIARTVCRRAERIMVAMPSRCCPGQEEALRYVNRLSDWLFVLARYYNHIAGMKETFWEPSK